MKKIATFLLLVSCMIEAYSIGVEVGQTNGLPTVIHGIFKQWKNGGGYDSMTFKLISGKMITVKYLNIPFDRKAKNHEGTDI